MTAVRALALCLLLSVISVHGQNFTGGYTFNLPPADTMAQPFLPAFPARPIGAEEYVRIDAAGHFAVDGTPIRFFGTNAVADGAFPTKAKAWFIAGRLRKMGFNLVRFHHMDNPWSSQSLFVWGSDTRHLNASTLDRLHYFIGELKKNGIYADINLHVSRTFRAADGVAGADSIQEYGKGVTLFDPYLLALQKEFAQQLLTQVNPYTGIPLASDPVVGMIEITNENSLYRMWRDGKLKPFDRGGALLARHSLMLDSLWQAFLRGRYGSTEALAAAWNATAGSSDTTTMLKNGLYESGSLAAWWVLEQNMGATAVATLDSVNPHGGKFAARVQVLSTAGANWHVQWKQTGLTLGKDSLYTLRFAARADIPRTVAVTLMHDQSPYTYYAGKDVVIDTGWTTIECTFRSPATDIGGARLTFNLGAAAGVTWFDDVALTRGVTTRGLLAGETLENNSVLRIDFGECLGFSDARVMDMTALYVTLQNDFYAAMSSYLKNTLHVQAPIVGTNWNVGLPDLAVQAGLDYVDNHAYWDHPSFPGVPWSSTDWLITNTPMVQATDGATIGGLMAGTPMKGKPYTISEYNHPFPNRYQSEAPLFLSSYGAFHDADAVMFFDYNGSSTDWETDMVSGYFDIHRNTALMSLMPSCARAFRDGLVASAQSPLLLRYSTADVLLTPKRDSGIWSGPETVPRTLALRYALRTETFSQSVPFDASQLPPVPSNPYTTETGEITWNTNGLLSVASPGFIGLAGRLSAFGGARARDLILLSGSDFGVLTWVSLTQQPVASSSRSLLTLSSKVQNTGMFWDGTTTIHDQWGSAPTRMFPLNAFLRLHIHADSIRVHRLGTSGEMTGSWHTYLPADTNTFVVTLDQGVDPTPWFGLEAFGSGTTSIAFSAASGLPQRSTLEQNYPNPFNPTSDIRYQMSEFSFARLVVYDLLGREVAVLVNEKKEPGSYSVTFDGLGLASGVYLYRLTAGSIDQTRRMILLH
jgi:hypothetical protein